MKRTLGSFVAAASTAVLLVAGGPAHAQNLGPCTEEYMRDVARTPPPQLIVYTPPASIVVDGDALLGLVVYLHDSTRGYIRCLSFRG